MKKWLLAVALLICIPLVNAASNVIISDIQFEWVGIIAIAVILIIVRKFKKKMQMHTLRGDL